MTNGVMEIIAGLSEAGKEMALTMTEAVEKTEDKLLEHESAILSLSNAYRLSMRENCALRFILTAILSQGIRSDPNYIQDITTKAHDLLDQSDLESDFCSEVAEELDAMADNAALLSTQA